ncbi:hypothetical protein GBA52_023158 [Prunus armeniaca]|nr:hypothetical protein GBA52_023158 [Prunus armeniaca]
MWEASWKCKCAPMGHIFAANLGGAAPQPDYCGTVGCEPMCLDPKPTPTPVVAVVVMSASVVSSIVFDQMLKHRNDARCKSNGFYKYDAFIVTAFGLLMGLAQPGCYVPSRGACRFLGSNLS